MLLLPRLVLWILALGVPTTVLPAANSPVLQWQFTTAGRLVGSPALAGDRLIIGSDDGHVYALAARDGTLLWRHSTGGAVACTPAIADQTVYLTSHDGSLYALELATGEKRWAFATGGEQRVDPWDYSLSSPQIEGDTVYFGSGDGHVYAIDRRSGDVRWKHAVGAVVHASPRLHEGILYIGDFGGRLHALDARTGEPRWVFKTVGDRHFPAGAIQSAVTLAGGVVYVGSRDYNLYALDAARGHGWWNIKEGSWVIGAPAVGHGLVVHGTSDTAVIVARDALTGSERWRRPARLNVFSDGLVHADWVVFGGFDGRLRALDTQTGELAWEYRTDASELNGALIFASEEARHPDLAQRFANDYVRVYDAILSLGSILAPPVIEGDRIYFTAADGVVRALRLPGR